MVKKLRDRDNWIQEAIKHPGALTRWLKRNRKKIKKIIGMDPFTKSGEISQRALYKIKKSKLWDELSPTIKRRINLAITLEKLRKG